MLIIRLKMTELLLPDNKMISKYIYHFIIVKKKSYTNKANKINTGNNPLLFFVCLFCCFTSQVNSYGHCGTVSSPNHTFFLGKLEQAVNQ